MEIEALTNLRKCLAFLTPKMRWRWAGLVLIAVAAAVMEAFGAAAVFVLIKVINDPARVSEMPVASMIYQVLPSQNSRTIVLSFTILVAMFYVLKNGLQLLGTYVSSKFAGDAVVALSRQMLRAYLTAPYAFHLRRNSAELIRNTHYSVDMVFRTVMASAVTVGAELLVVVGIAAVLMAVAPTVTLIAGTALATLSAVLLRLTRRAIVRWGPQVEELRKAILQSLQQAFGGLKEIKVLGRERFFYDLFSQRQNSLVRIQYLYMTLSVVPRLLVETLFICGALFVTVLVILLGSVGSDAVSLLGLYAYSGFRVIPSLNRILWNINAVRFGTSAIGHLYRDFVTVARNAPDDLDRSEQERFAFADRLVLDQVSYTYDGADAPVLRDVNLTIQPGESIGIFGPTGAGKSTLVDIIVGLLQPSSGRITVDDVDVLERLSSWQHQIGYVSQAIFLTDDSLRRNIALGIPEKDIDEGKVSRAIRMAQLEDFVASLPEGLDTFVGERGVRLSGGERQRVGIARALYHDPAVLVFDEAASALDSRTEAEVNRAIEALHGVKTLIIVTHRLTSVRRCNRIVFLLSGRVAGCGPFDKLIEQNADFRAMAFLTEPDRSVPQS